MKTTPEVFKKTKLLNTKQNTIKWYQKGPFQYKLFTYCSSNKRQKFPRILLLSRRVRNKKKHTFFRILPLGSTYTVEA
jgi:hypothetical protein